jgi:hypothetical protein
VVVYHVGGLCNEDGQPTFPNASISLAENDFAYWTDEALLANLRGPALKQRLAQLLGK